VAPDPGRSGRGSRHLRRHRLHHHVPELRRTRKRPGNSSTFLFQPEQRIEFTKNEGFLPVTKAEAADPHFANDPDLKVFTDLLPNARFAPVIPGWEEIADLTSSAIQNIYLGQGEIEQTLKDAAARADAIEKQ
jgi:multiple sugar transport system substrate-binding protein